MSTEKKINPNRLALIALSRKVKGMMESGQLPDAEKVNDGLVEIYRQQKKCSAFATMTGWNEKGMKIKKGATAVWVWGAPRQDQVKEETVDAAGIVHEEEKRLLWWPMAKLFADTDVEPMSDKMKAFIDKKHASFRKPRAMGVE